MQSHLQRSNTTWIFTRSSQPRKWLAHDERQGQRAAQAACIELLQQAHKATATHNRKCMHDTMKTYLGGCGKASQIHHTNARQLQNGVHGHQFLIAALSSATQMQRAPFPTLASPEQLPGLISFHAYSWQQSKQATNRKSAKKSFIWATAGLLLGASTVMLSCVRTRNAPQRSHFIKQPATGQARTDCEKPREPRPPTSRAT